MQLIVRDLVKRWQVVTNSDGFQNSSIYSDSSDGRLFLKLKPKKLFVLLAKLMLLNIISFV